MDLLLHLDVCSTKQVSPECPVNMGWPQKCGNVWSRCTSNVHARKHFKGAEARLTNAELRRLMWEEKTETRIIGARGNLLHLMPEKEDADGNAFKSIHTIYRLTNLLRCPFNFQLGKVGSI